MFGIIIFWIVPQTARVHCDGVLWLVAQSVSDVLIVWVPVLRNESSATQLLTERQA